MSQTLLFDLQPQKRVWKVSEITDQISAILEGTFPDIWIEGEVSNYRPAQSGHIYFTLKDSRAQIRCVCFRDQARLLKFRPDDGLHVTIRGSLGVYETRGEYQVYVSHIEPVGLGALQVAFEQLKKQLSGEGLFDAERKKPLPVLPRCIGVISSPSGAAIRDILRVLKRRFANVYVQLYPVHVQGDGAAGEIAAALRYFNREKFADVLILARGGGSIEDLWAFNEETVARAISASLIPVITGVGHETDFTIADFVADVRAPTPSAAAEIVVRSREEFEKHIAESQRQLIHHLRYFLSQKRHHVRDLQAHRGFRQIETLIRRRQQRADELSASLAVSLRLRLVAGRQRLTKAEAKISSFDLRGRASLLRRRIDQQRSALFSALERLTAYKRRRFNQAHLRFVALDLRGRASLLRRKLDQQRSALFSALERLTVHKRRRFNQANLQFAALDLRARVGNLRLRAERQSAELRKRMDRLLVARRRRLESADLQLHERSPFQILERGYSVAYDSAGRVLRSPDQIAVGAEISVRLAKGELDATVRDKRKLEP